MDVRAIQVLILSPCWGLIGRAKAEMPQNCKPPPLETRYGEDEVEGTTLLKYMVNRILLNV
jgi:hypothetical protein